MYIDQQRSYSDTGAIRTLDQHHQLGSSSCMRRRKSGSFRDYVYCQVSLSVSQWQNYLTAVQTVVVVVLIGVRMRSTCITRPRRRRLEAFTTDSKIIRLISRRVAIFPAAAACQIFDGDCDAANRKKIPGWYRQISDLVIPRRQNPA